MCICALRRENLGPRPKVQGSISCGRFSLQSSVSCGVFVDAGRSVGRDRASPGGDAADEHSGHEKEFVYN